VAVTLSKPPRKETELSFAAAACEVDIGRRDRRALGRGVDHSLDAGSCGALSTNNANELFHVMAPKGERWQARSTC
jgi:hypothetical protein